MSGSRPVITRLRPTLVALCVAALIALGSAFVFEGTLTELGSLSDQRGALREGRLQLAQTLSLFNLETVARGFVLTGAEDYLEPYTLARAALPEAYAETRQIATAGQIEGFPWAELYRWVDERIRLAGELVQVLRPLAGDVDASGRGELVQHSSHNLIVFLLDTRRGLEHAAQHSDELREGDEA